jgi:hypothetical protein
MYNTIKKDGVVYFPIAKSKLKVFEQCQNNIEKYVYKHGKTIYIRFNWNLVTLFSTQQQLLQYHNERKKYINELISKHCSRNKECYITYIGSDTPKSDIDINLNCPTVQQVVASIMEEHYEKYNDSLEDMFDTNIYGSMIRQFGQDCSEVRTLQTFCHPDYFPLYSQRVWSFFRVAQAIKTKFIKSLSTPYKRLYEKCIKLERELPKKNSKLYSKYLDMYVKALHDPNPNYQVISDKFSMCKYLETDAYYSIGAVLHIVEHKKNIKPEVIYDSIYDNLGFALEILYKNGLCHVIIAQLKIMKMCKYLARICDAYKLLTGKDTLDDLYKSSEKLNQMRKKHNFNKTAIARVQALLARLNIKSLEIDDVAIGLVSFILKAIPKDRLLLG